MIPERPGRRNGEFYGSLIAFCFSIMPAFAIVDDMSTRHFVDICIAVACAATLLVSGCDEKPAPKKAPASPAGASNPSKKVEVGKNVFLEIQGDKRRVVVNAYVCFREGMLEQLMCRTQTKEHEAILAADMDARTIHKALLVTGAEAGSPVQFEPKFQPPRGTTIKVSLQYQDKGKTVTVPAQKWVRNAKTGKELAVDWVFAGSHLFTDPNDKTPPIYAANDGDVICVSNFDTAMLDLPINSPKDWSDRAFEAYTERIPPLETPVLVILEPVLDAKKNTSR